jgi:hypothetical protein
MNSSNLAWRFIILLLLPIISAVSCQQPNLPAANMSENISPEPGFEIPQGTEPQRAETYDDIISCGPGLVDYRANCGRPEVHDPDYIKEAEVTFSGCEFTPSVTYRDYIETKAGQVRYNIFFMDVLDKSIQSWVARKTALLHYSIKLAGTVPDIQVKNVGALLKQIGPYTQDHIMIEISPQVKPGDYTLYFVLDDNGQNCGELPCVIHVTE